MARPSTTAVAKSAFGPATGFRLLLAFFICSLLLSAQPIHALLRYDPEDYYKIADGGISEGKWAPLVAADDFDGDGHADVLIPKKTSNNSFNLTLYKGRGDGLFPAFPEVLHATGHHGEVTAVVAGDLNDDGRADAVVGRSRNFFAKEPYALLFVLLSSSGGGVEYVPVVAEDEVRGPSGAAVPVNRIHAIRLADLDRDGDLDIVAVVTDWSAGAVLYLENIDGMGRTYKQHVLFDELLGYGRVDVGDMDNDGDDDIVVLSGGRDLMWILSNQIQSGRGFATSLVDTSARFPRSVAVGDLDGDGWRDIVKGGNNQLSIYHNKRDGTFQKLTIDEDNPGSWDGPDAYTQVVIRDVDGDGLSDIITPGGSKIKWAQQVESYQFSGIQAYFKSLPGVYFSEATLVFADLNEDGINGDMIVKDRWGEEVKVYFSREVGENTSPSFSTTTSSTTTSEQNDDGHHHPNDSPPAAGAAGTSAQDSSRNEAPASGTSSQTTQPTFKTRQENQENRRDENNSLPASGATDNGAQPTSGAASLVSFQASFQGSIWFLFLFCMILSLI